MDNEFKSLSLIEQGIKLDLIKVKEGDKIPYRFNELFSHYLHFHTLLKLYASVNLIDHSSVISLEQQLDSCLVQLRDNIKSELTSSKGELHE